MSNIINKGQLSASDKKMSPPSDKTKTLPPARNELLLSVRDRRPSSTGGEKPLPLRDKRSQTPQPRDKGSTLDKDKRSTPLREKDETLPLAMLPVGDNIPTLSRDKILQTPPSGD